MNQITRFRNLFRYLLASFEFLAVIHVTLEKKCVVDVLITTNNVKVCILIKSFSVSSIHKRTVYHYESILLLPTATTQFAEILIKHVGVYMIIVCFKLISSCLNRINRFALSRYQICKYETGIFL